jgi:hypothetical protein
MTAAKVSTAAQLLAALSVADEIEVDGTIAGMPMIDLRPGVTLGGGVLRFGAKGVRLSRDNRLEDITILVPDHEVAIGNDTSVADMGRLELRNVATIGQVLLVADHAVRAGHIAVDGLSIVAADVRGRADRPHGFGVDAMQGAFTLWNRQPDPAVRITATIAGVSAGRTDEPVRGSGVFVAGHGDRDGRGDGGVVEADLLRTGEIWSDGGIEPGTPDLISAGVFVVSGAHVDAVLNEAPVTTIGANDMVLDNWGSVGTWTARGPVTSHGASGIGFVNFGTLERLHVEASVTTYGAGARGFNVYDGRLAAARFHSITTQGDGAIGIQVSRDLPDLRIDESVTTFGGAGTSLVRGHQVTLSAIAVSVQPSGRIGRLTVGGTLSTHGERSAALDVDGRIDRLDVARGISAAGRGSDAVHLTGPVNGLDDTRVTAAHGQPVVRAPVVGTAAQPDRPERGNQHREGEADE